MQTEIEPSPARHPVVRKAAAGVVLIVAVAIAIKIAFGLIMTVFWVVVGAAVVAAILWALKTLLW